MIDKKIKVYGVLNEEWQSKIKDEIGVISTIFDSGDITHCVLTFNKDNMIVYAALCDENTIGVCVEEKEKNKEK